MYRSLLLALGLLLTAYVPALAQDGGLPVPELPDPGDLFADEEMEMPPTEPEVKLSFIYLYATDLAAMRHFYTDLLGLSETSYQEGPEGWLGYKSGGLGGTARLGRRDRAARVLVDRRRRDGVEQGEDFE